MVIVAFVLGVVGLLCAIATICLGVYIAFRKPKREVPLPSGLYRVTTVGYNKVTGVPEYEFDLVQEEKKDEGVKDENKI